MNMIKEAKFPTINETDLRLYKETFNFAPSKIDVTKAKIEKVVVKPKKEVSMKLKNPSHTTKLKEVDLSLKKVAFSTKLK